MADQLAHAVPARRRPQRTLTPQELDIVRCVDLLTLHKSLLLGLVDPVPNASPMSEEEGTWVREHAWTQEFHVIDCGYPWGFWRWSMCERGTCWNCLSKRCDLCVHRQQGGPTVDSNTAWVSNHRGRPVARLIERPGGEPCVWWCRCPCPKTGPVAEPEPSRKEAASASPDPVAACAFEQPYSYTDLQAHRLTLYPATDLSDRPYVWLEAENLTGRTVTVASVWLRPDQAAALRRGLAAGIRYKTLDHTGDRLIVWPGVETVVEVTRQPVVGETSATVRVCIPSDRLPEFGTAVVATAEQAQQRAVGARLELRRPESARQQACGEQLDLFGGAS